jgi:chromosome segregation ATPase
MNERIHEQLDKILALADSNHDGEAVVAVRKARQMLIRDGLSFSDLARAASSRQNVTKSSSMLSFLSGQNDYMESQIQHLRQQVEDLQAQMQTQELQLDFWRRRAADLEQSSTQAYNEAERWKKMARETVDRLWDIGKSINGEEFSLTEPANLDVTAAAKGNR